MLKATNNQIDDSPCKPVPKGSSRWAEFLSGYDYGFEEKIMTTNSRSQQRQSNQAKTVFSWETDEFSLWAKAVRQQMLDALERRERTGT